MAGTASYKGVRYATAGRWEYPRRVMILGEKETHIGKPSMLKMIGTMLTNKAVGQ